MHIYGEDKGKLDELAKEIENINDNILNTSDEIIEAEAMMGREFIFLTCSRCSIFQAIFTCLLSHGNHVMYGNM